MISPFPPCGSCCSDDRPHGSLDVVRHQFELARGQPEAFAVADRPDFVDEHDQGIFAVEQLVHEFMNAPDVATERLTKRQQLCLRREASPVRARIAAAGRPSSMRGASCVRADRSRRRPPCRSARNVVAP